MAPQTSQGTSLQEDTGPYPRPIMQGEGLDIADHAFYSMFYSQQTESSIRPCLIQCAIDDVTLRFFGQACETGTETTDADE